MFTLKMLIAQPARLILTVGGVALCVLLMLFLWSVYSGVSIGSVEYVRQSQADLWVLQQHATNILRGSSLLTEGHGYVLREVPGVASAAPILFILATVHCRDRNSTLYLTGYDPTTGIGGPPRLVKGRNVVDNDEIVLDRSFAQKFKFTIGDSLTINDATLKVVGLSSGTNMFVIQYAFVTLARAKLIAGFPNIVSCYQIRLSESADISLVIHTIDDELPGVEVYTQDQFLKNNIEEMKSGFLPLLHIVALIGAVVMTAILSLTITISILERRQDFAVMKAVGAPQGFIPSLIVKQMLIIGGIGVLTAFLLFFPMVWLVKISAPEVSAEPSWLQMLVVGLSSCCISLLSALLPLRRLRSIYPMEAFK